MLRTIRLSLLPAAALAACSTPPAHIPPQEVPTGLQRREGESFLQARVHYGIPILQRSFFWDGNGESDDFGPGLYAFHHYSDNVAFGFGGNLATWLLGGPDAYSGEFEGLARIYPDPTLPLFLDFSAGYLHATEPVPPGGTEWNFTFGFGPGMEIPWGEGSSLLLGATYHHISNALGHDNPRNPSQNEARLWVGYAWNF
ncbi:MAG: hypothetical protein IT456_12355 [Planctomycetes bacterium]|jgi:hypothetical protein|nr:hypothetical protein [Planctomycetota bacterium]